MRDVSVLVGGKAGDGINIAGLTIAHLFNEMGYYIYMYFDYPSLIKGGHNFAVIRASEKKIGAHRNPVDYVLALNTETLDAHVARMNPGTTVIYNADTVKNRPGLAVPVGEILAAEQGLPIMGNSAMIGGFAGAAGIPWDVVERVFRRHLPKEIEKNLSVAQKAYNITQGEEKFPVSKARGMSVLTGNEAMGLGLVHGGIDAFVAYPMTPTSNLLHFLAEQARRLPITVVHPENEIGVMIMALGFAYAGKQAAIGTSGGGFCLMTEGLSFAGQAELPVVMVVGQRTGPSTGLPTYTGQSELPFVLYAGQGEFPRFIVAPGDPEESFEWSSRAARIAWKYQVPAIILGDKTLNEGTYSFDSGLTREYSSDAIPPVELGETGDKYARYRYTTSGVSPMLFPGAKDTTVKVTSYTHDEKGISTENPEITRQVAEKRGRKLASLQEEIDRLDAVRVQGNQRSPDVLLAWGSNKGVALEVSELMGLRCVRPIVISPFPVQQMQDALAGASRVVVVEDNCTGQMSSLLAGHGITTHHRLLKYDGRPFSVEELTSRVKEVLS